MDDQAFEPSEEITLDILEKNEFLVKPFQFSTIADNNFDFFNQSNEILILRFQASLPFSLTSAHFELAVKDFARFVTSSEAHFQYVINAKNAKPRPRTAIITILQPVEHGEPGGDTERAPKEKLILLKQDKENLVIDPPNTLIQPGDPVVFENQTSLSLNVAFQTAIPFDQRSKAIEIGPNNKVGRTVQKEQIFSFLVEPVEADPPILPALGNLVLTL